jgi:hypothetical protein
MSHDHDAFTAGCKTCEERRATDLGQGSREQSFRADSPAMPLRPQPEALVRPRWNAR